MRDRFTVPCVSFLSPDRFLCLWVILFQQRVELWTTLLTTAANDKACEDQWSYCASQRKKAADCKVNEAETVPFQEALSQPTPDSRLALQLQQPETGPAPIWRLTTRDIGVTEKMSTHPPLQIMCDLCHQVTFPHRALWKWWGQCEWNQFYFEIKSLVLSTLSPTETPYVPHIIATILQY